MIFYSNVKICLLFCVHTKDFCYKIRKKVNFKCHYQCIIGLTSLDEVSRYTGIRGINNQLISKSKNFNNDK